MQEINGKFIQALPNVEGDSAKGHWIKGGFVIEYGTDYPKQVAFTLFGADRIMLLGNLQPGQAVIVKYAPESREFNGRWYTDLRCINVSPAMPAQPQPQAYSAPLPQAPALTHKDDELPF